MHAVDRDAAARDDGLHAVEQLQLARARETRLEFVGEGLAVAERTRRIDHQHRVAARGPDLRHDGEVRPPRQVRPAVQPQDQRHLDVGRHVRGTHQPRLPAARRAGGRQPQLLHRRHGATHEPRRLVRQHFLERAVGREQRDLVRARAVAAQARDAAVARHGQALGVQRIARGGAAADVAAERRPLAVARDAREAAGAVVDEERQQARAVGQPLQALVDVEAGRVRQRDDGAAVARHHVHDTGLERGLAIAIADERDPSAVGRHGGAADRATELGETPHLAAPDVELVHVGLDDRARVERPGGGRMALHRHDDVAAVRRPRDAAREAQLGDVDERAAVVPRPERELARHATACDVQQEDVVMAVGRLAVVALDAAHQFLAVDAARRPGRRAHRLPGRQRRGRRRRRHALDERERAAVGRPREAAGRLGQAREHATFAAVRRSPTLQAFPLWSSRSARRHPPGAGIHLNGRSLPGRGMRPVA